MAGANIEINKKEASNALPIPIIGLGCNFVLQHKRSQDFNTFINDTYSFGLNTILPGVETKTGVDWANSNLRVGISFAKTENDSYFLDNTPMVFLEVLSSINNSNVNKRLNKSQYTHPVNFPAPLNRTGTNYGGGDALGLITEWDFTKKAFEEEVIELNQQFLYRDNNVVLPIRLVDFVSNMSNNLKYQRRFYGAPIEPGVGMVNTFNQRIQFRFAILDPKDGKSIILSNPSEPLLIRVKWGRFEPQDDTYVYDWEIKRC